MKRRLKKLLPKDWNKRPLSQGDFDFFCALDDVDVYEVEMFLPGFYCLYDDRPTIFINEALRGVEKLRVEFHELAHHWLHTPSIQFYSIGGEQKSDLEANIITACALIPRYLIQTMHPSEIAAEFGYSQELIEFRLKVLRRHKI